MCDCIDRCDEKLAEHNAQILTNMLGPQRCLITLWKKDDKKRGKLPLLQASFCPLCGEKYPENAPGVVLRAAEQGEG